MNNTREHLHPDYISIKTLEMIDQAMENFKEGKTSEPADMEELKKLLEE